MSTGDGAALDRVRYVDLGPASELRRRNRLVTTIDGVPVIVARRLGAPFAFVGYCPHMGSSLSDAHLGLSTVRCATHGYAWNVRTGAPVRSGRRCATGRLVLVPVEVIDGRLVAHWSDQLREQATADAPSSTAE